MLTLTSKFKIWSHVTNCVCLRVRTGFNLTMRAANFPFTAGLEPAREWIRRDPDHFKCQGSHCRADEVSVKGGGRESCKGQWHFPSRGDVRGSKSGFCLRVCVCVCSSSQGQARGESDAANQWRGRRWERHKHSQLSQPFLWGITRSERGRITSTVGRCFSFFFFF